MARRGYFDLYFILGQIAAIGFIDKPLTIFLSVFISPIFRRRRYYRRRYSLALAASSPGRLTVSQFILMIVAEMRIFRDLLGFTFAQGDYFTMAF